MGSCPHTHPAGLSTESPLIPDLLHSHCPGPCLTPCRTQRPQPSPLASNSVKPPGSLLNALLSPHAPLGPSHRLPGPQQHLQLDTCLPHPLRLSPPLLHPHPQHILLVNPRLHFSPSLEILSLARPQPYALGRQPSPCAPPPPPPGPTHLTAALSTSSSPCPPHCHREACLASHAAHRSPTTTQALPTHLPHTSTIHLHHRPGTWVLSLGCMAKALGVQGG